MSRRNLKLPPYITDEELRAMQQDRNEQLRKQPYDQDPRIPADAVEAPWWVAVLWIAFSAAVATIVLMLYTAWETWVK